MNEKKDCLFCKIINNEIPSSKIYEDEHTLAFLDIFTTGKIDGHILVIPKNHSENIYDIEFDDLNKLSSTIKKVSNAVKKATNCSGLNIVQSNGESAGQDIFHIHFHIIPRKSDDGVWFETKRRKLEPKKMNEIAKKIKKELQ